MNYDIINPPDGKFTPPISGDEGRAISNVAKDVSPNVDYNIYYVHSFTGSDKGLASRFYNEIFLPSDGMRSSENRTAHEVGHVLGIRGEDHSYDTKDVMYLRDHDSNPRRVRKLDWDIVNPTNP